MTARRERFLNIKEIFMAPNSGGLIDAENGLVSRRIFIEPEIYIEEVRFARDSPLEGTGFEPSVPAQGPAFFETAAELGDDELAASQSRILTIDKGRFTVRRARLAPAMISTPGHQASRRRQRGALPAWSRDAFSVPSTN